MAAASSHTFERMFPRRDMWRGKPRLIMLWSLAAALLLPVLLLVAFLLIGLLDHRGILEVPNSARADAEAFAGKPLSLEPLSDQQVTGFANSGILPTVWEIRDHAFGHALARLYRTVPALRSNSKALITLLAVAVFVGLLRGLAISRAASLSNSMGIDVASYLRKRLHRQTLRLGPSDLVDAESDSVLKLFTSDVEQVRDGIAGWLRPLIRHVPELAVLVVFALLLHWRVASQCLIPILACCYLVYRDQRRFESQRRQSGDRIRRGLARLSESLHKTRMVRGYGMEAFEEERFQTYLSRHRNEVGSIKRAESRLRWTRGVVLLLCSVLLAYLFTMKVLLPESAPDYLTITGALTLLATFVLIVRSLFTLGQAPDAKEAATDGARGIFLYIDRIPEVGQAVGARFLEPLSRSMQFESVSYVLPNGRKLLDNFDLRIRAGEKIALVSLDPIEARCVAWLLPRFIEPQSGRILFDGEDIAWVTLESLRAETNFVGERDPFFTGTVLENITCGLSEYSLQDATEAAKLTHAHKYILELSEGYATMLGEHGEQPDRGQGFRLGLARAVIRKPAIMIIEEPSEALDADTKALLDDAYKRIFENRTVLFLPGRLSTARRVDRIVLIHNGRVEATGSHSELLKSSSLYRHWEYVRFNEFTTRNETESQSG